MKSACTYLLACSLAVGGVYQGSSLHAAISDDVTFVSKLADMGLTRLAMAQAEEVHSTGKLRRLPKQELDLLVQMNRLCLELVKSSTDDAERQTYLKRAITLFADIRRRKPANTSGADLSLALLYFHQAEALLRIWQQSGTVKDNLHGILDTAIQQLGKVIDVKDRVIADIEKRMPAGADPRRKQSWRDAAHERGKARYHRGWANLYRGLSTPGAAGKNYFEASIDDLYGFTAGRLDNDIAVKALLGVTRCMSELGEQAEAVELLLEAIEEEQQPASQRASLLRGLVEVTGSDKTLKKRTHALLLAHIDQLSDKLRDKPEQQHLVNILLKWTAELYELDGDQRMQRLGIRLAEDLIGRGGKSVGTGFRYLLKLTAGGNQGRSHLQELLQAEQFFDKRAYSQAVKHYQRALRKRDRLPNPEIVLLVQLKLAAAQHGAGSPAAAEATLRPLIEAGISDARLDLIAKRLQLRCLEGLWRASKYADTDLGKRYHNCVRLLAEQGHHSLGPTVLTAIFVLLEGQATEAAEDLLNMIAKDERYSTDVDLLRRLLPALSMDPIDDAHVDLALRAIRLLRPELKVDTLGFTILTLLQRCDGIKELNARSSELARLIRNDDRLGARERRRADIYDLRAHTQAERLHVCPSLIDRVVAQAAESAWQAASFIATGRALQTKSTKTTTDVTRLRQRAINCYRAALPWYESAGHQRRVSDLRFTIAQLLLQLGDSDAARSLFAELPEDQRQTWQVKQGEALALEHSKRWPEAIALWRRISDHLPKGSPEWITAKRHLASCLLATGDAKQALNIAVFITELYSDLGKEAAAFSSLIFRCKQKLAAAAPSTTGTTP